MIQQSHYPPQPQVNGENFHLVGHTMPFNPISPLAPTPSAYGPAPTPSAYGPAPPQTKKQRTSNNTVNIEIDENDNNDENRTAKKRYWTPEEEERLVSNDLFYIL
jgi:hypothetical protein